MLTYSKTHSLFVWSDKDQQPAIQAGFDFSPAAGKHYTASPYIAYLLRQRADAAATSQLENIAYNIAASSATAPLLPGKKGLYPFQAAGVEHMTSVLHQRNAVLLADDAGNGKSCQSLCVAENLGAKRLLIICPASLRLNWLREISMWHPNADAAQAILTGKQSVHKGSVVVSYALAAMVKDEKFDAVIIDEAHNVKSLDAKRTKLILGDVNKKWYGIVRQAPTMFLSGSPLPNGKPSELWPILFRCAPDAISYLKYWPFLQRFCLLEDDGMGGAIVRGAKRQPELFARLRGSGFMTRRLKSEVLKDLPPIRFSLVVFPQDSRTRKVIEKESQFSAAEIIRYGVPVGSALPEVRREMGCAMAPTAAEFISELLESGTDKIVVFVHHIEVAGIINHMLRQYNPVMIIGSTPPTQRQINVDAFQTDPSVRVFIGNAAAQEGITLTAAHDVVLAEVDWVPGANDQRAGRCHRITQTERVIVYMLVVEGSLGAKILASAAFKALDSQKILDKGE